MEARLKAVQLLRPSQSQHVHSMCPFKKDFQRHVCHRSATHRRNMAESKEVDSETFMNCVRNYKFKMCQGKRHLVRKGVMGSTEEEENENKKIKLRVMYLTMIVTMIGVALMVSSTWSFLQKIDQDVSPEFLGWTNFAFNLAAIVADVVAGKWMHSRGSKEPLLAALSLGVVSGLLSAVAQGVGKKSGLWIIFVSRLFLGFTSGNLTITRSVVSEVTTSENRSRVMVNLSLAMTIGFAMGSGIQALISLIGEKEVFISALKLHINLYTIPSYLHICLLIANGLLALRYMRPAPKRSEQKDQPDDAPNPFKGKLLTCLTLIAMFALTNFALSLMETLTVPFVQDQFALTRAKAVWYGGIVFTCQGLIGISQQFVLRILLTKFSDRVIITVVYGFMVLSFFFCIPIGNMPLKIAGQYSGNNTFNYTSEEQLVGCPAKFDWCRDTPQVWLPQYLLGAVLFAIGYSSCLGLLVSIYTKIVAAKRQGKVVSLISSSGNVGRLMAPVAGSTSYIAIGPGYTFAWVACLLLSLYIAFILQFKKMVTKPAVLDQEEPLNSDESLQDASALHITSV